MILIVFLFILRTNVEQAFPGEVLIQNSGQTWMSWIAPMRHTTTIQFRRKNN